MFGSMFIFRIVAAAHMPASQAQAQVHPRVAHRQALLAPFSFGLYFLDVLDMLAGGLLEGSSGKDTVDSFFEHALLLF
jgi:hypothetical protein